MCLDTRPRKSAITVAKEKWQSVEGRGGGGSLSDIIHSTVVTLKDLTAAGKQAITKGFNLLQSNPDQLLDVLKVLAPHVQRALASKLKGVMVGSGLKLSGQGLSQLNETIATLAAKQLKIGVN